MQTFSKAFGLAAIRVGMAFSNPLIVKYFNKVKPPYNISTINQKTALRKLDNSKIMRSQVSKIKSERIRLTSELMKLKIIRKVYPSDANFLLVKVENADNLYNTLIDRNIIVRNRSKIVDNCIRITVGKKSENDILLEALKEYQDE